MKPDLRVALEAAAPGAVRTQVPLSELGRWSIGGPSALVVDPASVEQVQAAIRTLAEYSAPWIVIGEGSNILFDSDGYRGVVVRIGSALSRYQGDPSSGIVEVEAGLWTPYFVLKTLRLGLSGCVHAIGIPGMIGGLIAMNGGSQRRGIGDQLLDVTAIDRTGALHVFPREACGFAYRSSVFQRNGATIVAARFRYEIGDEVSALRREAREIMASRKRRFPKALPNCGSVFVSDPALYATLGSPGAAIEAVGLKGVASGNARISPQHANFIVNEGGARSDDVIALIGLARRRVFERTGVAMHSEVLHLSRDGALRPAHEASSDGHGATAAEAVAETLS